MTSPPKILNNFRLLAGHQRFGFALLAAVSALVGCNQTTVQPTRGNLDRVTDMVIVNAADGHSYTVTANPDLQHLRIVDMTTGAFVRSPNRYFPLSPPSAASELTVAVDVETTAIDGTRVFGLDPTGDTVDILHVADSDDDARAFAIVGSFETSRAPADVGAMRFATTTLVAVSVPATSAVDVYSVDDEHTAVLLRTVALPAGAFPDRVVVDPLGHAFVVGDAVGGALYLLEPTADGSDVVHARTLQLRGPVGSLSAGIVDVGDGAAPVVLALHNDGPTASLVRLFRRGYPEDRYAVLATAELPNVGAAGYVPDTRSTAATTTVCCLVDDNDPQTDTLIPTADTPSAAWAGVMLVDGRLLYLQLAAASIDGLALGETRRAMRLFDDDAAPPGASVTRNARTDKVESETDLNAEVTLWVPAEGGDDRRPVVTLTSVDTFGTPTFVPLVQPFETLLLTWEADLPTTTALVAVVVDNVVSAEVDLAARDVDSGDVARLTIGSPAADCEGVYRAAIVSVDGTALTLATSDVVDDTAPALTSTALACLADADVRLTVEVRDSFVVTEQATELGRYRQRLDFNGIIELPGRHVTVSPSAAGLPVAGSKLAIPLDARVTPLGLDIAGDFDARALVPTAIAGGTIIIPDVNSNVDDATIAARRMVVSAGSVDARLSQPRLFTFDEAETISGNIEPLQ
jgi:hypothetical protein